MEYTSFYGGRKGTSFIIVKDYKDIPSMVADFSQGGSFAEVNYDEYVIINTVNKNHPDNGKIFRRGYDYNGTRTISAYRAYDEDENEIINGTTEQYKEATYQYDGQYPSGGAIYVGTVVGPAGRAPHLHMTTYVTAQNKQATEGFEEQKTSGTYSMDNGDLLPGKDTSGTSTIFNDTIQWYCTSIRDDYDEDAQAYIGLKIPYHVIDFETAAVAPYNASGTYADMTAATRTDDGSHPFYEKWNLSIPHGIKGDTSKDFRIMVPTATDVIYTVGTTTQYPGFNEDVTGGREILVYDYYVYDDTNNPSPITYYIGDYNEISDFTIADNGTVTVAFTHNDTVTYNQLIKWVEDIHLDDETGELTITYNTGTQQGTTWIPDVDTFELDWVKDIRFNNNGTVYIDYTVSNTQTYPSLIKWINDISIATENIEAQEQGQEDIVEGTFAIQYNDATSLVAYLKWVNDITLSEHGALTLHYSGNGTDKEITSSEQNNFIKWINDVAVSNNGTMTITYNTGHYETEGGIEEQTQIWVPDTDQFTNAIKWVTGVTFDNNGNVIVNYNTGTSDTYANQIKWIQEVSLNTTTGLFTINYAQAGIDPLEVRLKWPTNLEIVTTDGASGEEGTGSQKVKVTYTTGDPVEIGNPLNYIMRTKITTDKHLIVLYSDPVKRQALINEGKAYHTGKAAPNQWTEDGYRGWLDLGAIYTDSGILIGLNIDPSTVTPKEGEYPTQTEVINYLNGLYSTGLTGDQNGKIVTVGIEGQDKAFYGFNYNKVDDTYIGWYYLGTFSAVAAALSPEAETPAIGTDGLWFIVEETFDITYNLINVESSNTASRIAAGAQYTTKLIGNNMSVTVTMGGRDITSSVYSAITNVVSITSSNMGGYTSVTGDIVITASGT